MKTIIISPWSKPLKNGNKNAKNYPHWEQVVILLQKENFHIKQIGCEGEASINAHDFIKNESLETLAKLAMESAAWVSVDNFFPHLCANIGRWGVVIWGKSDPKIFGYPQNINLLKHRRYMRQLQYWYWEEEPYDPDVFVAPEEVVKAVLIRSTHVNFVS